MYFQRSLVDINFFARTVSYTFSEMSSNWMQFLKVKIITRPFNKSANCGGGTCFYYELVYEE